MDQGPPTVLIAGGSGYLGQFLVDTFARDGWNVAYTYNTSTPPPFPKEPTAFKVRNSVSNCSTAQSQ